MSNIIATMSDDNKSDALVDSDRSNYSLDQILTEKPLPKLLTFTNGIGNSTEKDQVVKLRKSDF